MDDQRRVIKPDYVPISEDEARALLRSGRARKPSQAAGRLFTLKISIAVFVLFTASLIFYYTFFEEPLLLKPPAVAALAAPDSGTWAGLTASYNAAPSLPLLRSLAGTLQQGPAPAALSLDVLEQLVAWNATADARSYSLAAERHAGSDPDAKARLFWLKAHTAYREKNFEEARFYLRMLVNPPNRYAEEAQTAVEEIDALLDTSFWPDW